MTEPDHVRLKELQRLDEELSSIQMEVDRFDELLAEVAEPAETLEREVDTQRKRLQGMRVDENRLELAAEEKRARARKLQEHVDRIRNVREEAALRAEMDMIRRAIEADEREAYSLLDGIRRVEEQLREMEMQRDEARAAVEPRREELEAEKAGLGTRLESLRTERENSASGLEIRLLRLYESFRKGGRKVVVAEVREGACGHCFSAVPLQLQSEIRRGRGLIRCEACGVILTRPEETVEADES